VRGCLNILLRKRSGVIWGEMTSPRFFFLPPKPWPLLLKREECCSVASLASGKQSVCSQLEKNYPGKYPERAAATPHRKSHQGNGLFLQVHGNLSFETQSFLVA